MFVLKREIGVLVRSAVSFEAFGYSGYIRLWDLQSNHMVWETNELGAGQSSRFRDSFSYIDIDVKELNMFKLCSKSGDLAMVDMWHLKDDLWIYLKVKNPSLMSTKGVNNSFSHCYRKQVFIARDGGLEVWCSMERLRNGIEKGNGESEDFLKEILRNELTFALEDRIMVAESTL